MQPAMISFSLRNHSSPMIKLTRTLTISQSSTALRPFYFAVHPDLFGKFPKERAVNEASLKRLSEYLDGLHNKKRVKPASVTFFVRNTPDFYITKEKAKSTLNDQYVPETFREVRIKLLSPCPQEVVKTVLRSCNMSLDYVESLRTEGSGQASGSWRKIIYSFDGISYPFNPPPKKPTTTLSAWLKVNIATARHKKLMMLPILNQIEDLIRQIKERYHIEETLWKSYWGPVQYRACLVSFLRLCEQCGNELDIKGKRIIFSNDSGLSLDGHIVLRSDDVPDTWLSFLKSTDFHRAGLTALPGIETQLSRLLNNIKVSRRRGLLQSPQLVKDYLITVGKLVKSCDLFWNNNPEKIFDQDLTDIELVVACASGPLAVSDEGQILVPYSCPGYLLIDFLQRNSLKARQIQQIHVKNMTEMENLVEDVKADLELKTLTYDSNIPLDNVKKCCQHLLEDPRNLGIGLNDIELHITTFYSVMSDGQMCIPWNWVGLCDDRTS